MLTRDRGLLMRSIVTYGFCLHATDSEEQLTAVLNRFNLYDVLQPWTRCLSCNGRLQTVDKAHIEHRLEPKTRRYYHEFRMCQECEQIYWKGSHFADLQKWVDQIQNHSIPDTKER